MHIGYWIKQSFCVFLCNALVLALLDHWRVRTSLRELGPALVRCFFVVVVVDSELMAAPQTKKWKFVALEQKAQIIATAATGRKKGSITEEYGI